MENNLEKNCIINFLPAMHGDCFLIQMPNKKCILIDCGLSCTYKKELKPLLQNLSVQGYRISLLIITHMDMDHIGGAISFLEDNQDSDNPKIIPIDNILFNGIYDICKYDGEIISRVVREVPEDLLDKTKYRLAYFKRKLSNDDELISARQSISFELLCSSYHYNVNKGCNNTLIQSDDVFHDDNFEVRILSPGKQELDSLAKWIDNSLKRDLGEEYLLEENLFTNYIESMMMAKGKDGIGTTRSIEISTGIPNIDSWLNSSSLSPMNEVNKSSIVVEITCNGKSMLFMGDSESEDWIEKAKKRYDLVKISHHGTTKPNIKLIEEIRFDKAIISTNGKRNNHPEDELLARLIKAEVKELYFNYDIRRKNDVMKLQHIFGYKSYFGNKQIVL